MARDPRRIAPDSAVWDRFRSWPRQSARLLIRAYQLTFSALVGRQCRYLPTCSDYAQEAIGHYGVWSGGWMGLARLCRCHPWGGSGYDPIPASLPRIPWYRPWAYGRWRGQI